MTIRFQITNDSINTKAFNNKMMTEPNSSNKGGFSMRDNRFCSKATTKAIKDNYRYELEKFKGFKKILVEAKIGTKSTKHVDNMFGGYKVKTICLEDIKLILRSKKDDKLKVVCKLDHLWINEEENTIVRDKNNEVGDVVRFHAYIKEYTYSHGGKQLGLGQHEPWHKNKTQGHEYKR